MSPSKSRSQIFDRKGADEVDERSSNISVVVTHSAPSHHASPMRAASTTSRFANSIGRISRSSLGRSSVGISPPQSHPDSVDIRVIPSVSNVQQEPSSGNYLSTRISASNVHTQLQSTLFTTLFPELRNIVFTLALTEYDDPTRPYSKHECFYRPGFEFVGRIDTNLLLSCRLVYLETHLAPIALNEHVFWMHSSRGPPGRSITNCDHGLYFRRMTPQQRAAVSQVRFFTQMFWLEGRKFQEWPAGLAVRKLAITIRHSDWWFWENGEALRIKAPREGWGAWVGSIPQLEELELEFETIEPKKEQLEERVRVAQGWRFPLADGASLVHDGEAPVKSMWAGTSRMAPGRASNVWGAPRNPQVEASLDLRFPLDLKLHVRKLKFVKSIRSL